MATTLQAFLKEKYVKLTKANADKITHKRIKDEANHIGGGTYIIQGEDLATFYGLVYNEAVVLGNIWTLTERQSSDDRILIDLDFKHAHGTERKWDYDDAHNILQEYMEQLKLLVDFKAGQKVSAYIMARDAPNHLPDGTKTKDGIHIIINLKLKRKLQAELRKRVMAKAVEEGTEIKGVMDKLELTNGLNDVFDESITKGGTDWQIIGCRKSATAGVYKIQRQFKYELDPADREWMLEIGDPIPTPPPREIFNDVIVTATKTECELTRDGQRIINPTAEANNRRDTERQQLLDEAVPEDIIKLYQCLDTVKRCGAGTHSNWVGVMLATKGAIGDAGKEIFVEWSWTFGDPHTRADQDAVADLYDQANPTALTAGSLHYWAREDNPELYRELFTRQEKVIKMKTAEEQMDTILTNGYTEYKMAVLFKILHGDVHVCQDRERRTIYNFTNEMMWQKDTGVIIRLKLSERLPPLFKAKIVQLTEERDALDPIEDEQLIDAINRKINGCSNAIYKLESTNDKEKIFKEIADLLYKPKFLDDFNRAKDELPIKPRSVVHLQTLEVRQRTIKDKWTYECDAEFLEGDKFKAEDEMWMKTYFLQLFRHRADTMETTLDIFKTSLSGRVVRHMFFLLGEKGSNGKSLMIKGLQETFTGATDTISKKIIVQDNRATSALNTEVEKLENCRVALTSEFDKNEKMNIKMIKEVSGGDRICLRGMRETERTIKPTANLFAVTNDMPSMKIKNPKEQSAFFKRLIIIPFNAEFENDTEFEANFLKKKSQLLTFILKHGTIREKFNITDEMVSAIQEYQEESTADSFNDFIKAKIEECEYDDGTIQGRNSTRLDQKSIIEAYNAYCQQLGNHPEKKTPTKWHKEIMAKFNFTAEDSKESGGKRYYNGLRWLKEEENEE
jgi:phage/plasmid-associated DNA primase